MERLGHVRTRLDSLEYREPLGIESLPLVERLLSDVIHTSESARTLQVERDELAAALVVWKNQMEPLKRENSRLIRENNLLHTSMISESESATAREQDLKRTIKLLEDDLSDKTFVSTQYRQKIEQYEQDLDELRRQFDSGNFNTEQDFELPQPVGRAEVLRAPRRPTDPHTIDILSAADARISDLQSATRHLTVEKTALQEKVKILEDRIRARDGEIERMGKLIEGGKETNLISLEHINHSNQDVIEHLNIQVDVLQEQVAAQEAELSQHRHAERHVSNLEEKNQELMEELATVTARNGTLESEMRSIQAMARDLRKGGDGSRQAALADEVSALREEVQRHERAAAQQKSQSDRLAEDNARLAQQHDGIAEVMEAYSADKTAFGELVSKLESEKNEAVGAHTELRRAYDDLLSQLTHAQQERGECDRRVGEVEREAESYQRALAKLREEMDSADDTVHRMSAEVQRLEGVVAHVRRDNEGLHLELRGIREKHEHASAESQRKEEALQEATERMADLSTANRQLQLSLASMEEERTFLKKEADTLRRGVAGEAGTLLDLQAAVSDKSAQLSRCQTELAALKSENSKLTEQVISRDAEIRKLAVNNSSLEVGQQQNSVLHSRMEQMKDELTSLKEEGGAKEIECARLARDNKHKHVQLEQMKEDVQELTDKLARAQRDNIGLSSILQQFEGQQADIQSTIRALTADRDEISHLYEEMVGRVRASAEDQRNTVVESEQQHGAIKMLETEKATLERRVSILTEENKQVHKELQAARDEVAALMGTGDEVSKDRARMASEMSHVRGERDQAQEEVAAMNEIILGLQQQREQLRNELQDTKRRELEHKGTGERLRMVVAQLEGTRDDLAARVQQKIQDAQMSEKRTTAAENARASAEEHARQSAAEVMRLTASIASLDQERDALQAELDAKDEEIMRLSKEVSSTGQAQDAATMECDDMRAQIVLNAEQLNGKDQELVSLRQQVRTLEQTRAVLEGECQVQSDRAASLEEDLRNMTRENQIVNGDLSQVIQERNELHKELQDVCLRAQHVEELVRSKEREKDDLLKSYQGVSAENQRLAMSAGALASETEVARKEAERKEHDLQVIRNQLRALEEENRCYVIDLKAFERQSHNLSRSQLDTEAHMSVLEAANESLTRDLTAARHLAEDLEVSKRSLQKDAAIAEQEIGALLAQLEDARAARDAGAKQLKAESQRASELEELLSLERTRELRTELAGQAAEANNGRLQERVEELERDRRESQLQLRSLRESKNHGEIEMEHLKRDLNAARFEREASLGQTSTLDSQARTLQSTVDQQYKVISEMDEERKKLKDYVVKYEHELTECEEALRRATAEARQKDEEVRHLQSKLADAEASEETVRREVRTLREQAHVLERRAAREGGASVDMNRHLHDQREKLSEARQDLAQCKRQLVDLNLANERLQREKVKLEETLEKMADNWHAYNSQLRQHLASSEGVAVEGVISSAS